MYQTSWLQLPHQPYLLEVANHSPFVSVPWSTPFHSTIKGETFWCHHEWCVPGSWSVRRDPQVSTDFHNVLQFLFLIQVGSRFTLIFKLMSCDLTCCFKRCREAYLVLSLSMFISVLKIVFIYCRVLSFPFLSLCLYSLFLPLWLLYIIERAH